MRYRQPDILRRQLCLYWVLNGLELDSEAGRGRVMQALQAGVTCLQLRDKESATTALIQRAKVLLELARPWHALVLINDRVDVAQHAGAHGVHLGQSDMSVAHARQILGGHSVIGLSVEYPWQLESAMELDVDYLAISPVFDTPTKADTAPAWGLNALRDARKSTELPLVAIGGINRCRLPQLWNTGVDGLAVVSALSNASNPYEVATDWRALMAQTRSTVVPRVLSIAGSDSGGCAGVQADLKTIAALGCHGMTAVTALTAQNTVGVQGVQRVPAKFLSDQISSTLIDIGADAIKIGMLPTLSHVDVVGWWLQQHSNLPSVLDPVMVSSSGATLVSPKTVASSRKKLFPRCTVVTPNIDELALLTNRPIKSLGQALAAGLELVQEGSPAVLVKGGHLIGSEVTDTLLTQEGVIWQQTAPRLRTRNSHGSGCTLSSAIAAYMAQGLPLVSAVTYAHQWVRNALLGALDLNLGAGHGPLNHFHSPLRMGERLTGNA